MNDYVGHVLIFNWELNMENESFNAACLAEQQQIPNYSLWF